MQSKLLKTKVFVWNKEENNQQGSEKIVLFFIQQIFSSLSTVQSGQFNLEPKLWTENTNSEDSSVYFQQTPPVLKTRELTNICSQILNMIYLLILYQDYAPSPKFWSNKSKFQLLENIQQIEKSRKSFVSLLQHHHKEISNQDSFCKIKYMWLWEIRNVQYKR